jgi:hypothetical protein
MSIRRYQSLCRYVLFSLSLTLPLQDIMQGIPFPLIPAGRFLAGCVEASEAYSYDPRNEVLGSVRQYMVKYNESLYQIARMYKAGFNESVAANPGIYPYGPTYCKFNKEVRIGQEAELISLRCQVFFARPHLEKRLHIPAEPLTKNRTLLTSAMCQDLVRDGYPSFFMIGNGRSTSIDRHIQQGRAALPDNLTKWDENSGQV